MKPLLFTLEYPPFHGGVAHYYFNLVKHYPEEITVLNNNDNELIKDSLPALKWLPCFKYLYQAIKQDDINYVIVGNILPLGTVTLIMSFFFNIKYSVILHGYDLSCAQQTTRKKRVTDLVLSNAENIICANSYTANKVKEIINQNELGKVKVINPGIDIKNNQYNQNDIEELKKKYNLENKTTILTVARLVKRKGVDNALESFKKAKYQNNDLKYIIIGQGPEEEDIKRQIERLGLKNDVVLLTSVSDEEKRNWYQLCDIFLMTAREIDDNIEGFGIVYLEANLYSKPVIAGNSGGVGDAVINDLNGLLVDPNNTKEITEAILKLSNYKSIRDRLGDSGRQRAIHEFNWNKQAKKFYDIVNKNR